MPRQKKKGRKNYAQPMSLKELCNAIGITPQQRLVMMRYMKRGETKI